MTHSHRNTAAKLLACAAAVSMLMSTSPNASADQSHTVRAGQTLGIIAKLHNTTVEAICAANKITPRTTIKPGQKISIPDPPSSRNTTSSNSSSSSKSRSASTSPQSPSQSAQAHTSQTQTPKPSQQSSTPPKPNTKPARQNTAYTTHVVASGNVLVSIARRYDSSVELIEEANDLGPGQTLRVGSCLIIPLPNSTGNPQSRKLPCDPDGSGLANHGFNVRPTNSGIVFLDRGGVTFQGRLIDSKGQPIPAAVTKVNNLLFDRRTASTHSISPALLRKLTEVSNHFGGRRIIVVSGYRGESSNRYTTRSNHALGRAIDFSIEGVSNEELRDFCHKMTGVGVGYYPNSTFIHLDVRSTTTHWTDVSGPGERPRYTSVEAPPDPPPKTKKKSR